MGTDPESLNGMGPVCAGKIYVRAILNPFFSDPSFNSMARTLMSIQMLCRVCLPRRKGFVATLSHFSPPRTLGTMAEKSHLLHGLCQTGHPASAIRALTGVDRRRARSAAVRAGITRRLSFVVQCQESRD